MCVCVCDLTQVRKLLNTLRTVPPPSPPKIVFSSSLHALSACSLRGLAQRHLLFWDTRNARGCLSPFGERPKGPYHLPKEVPSSTIRSYTLICVGASVTAWRRLCSNACGVHECVWSCMHKVQTCFPQLLLKNAYISNTHVIHVCVYIYMIYIYIYIYIRIHAFSPPIRYEDVPVIWLRMHAHGNLCAHAGLRTCTRRRGTCRV
jgi:hypothetical protein